MPRPGTTTRLSPLTSAIIAAALLVAPEAMAQRGRFASPDAAQWKKPPLIKWQRSLEDALWLAKAKNLPLLICVNMDGERGRQEPASANFAGVRYRDPAFAALVESYIPLIVSPDRHTPKDHDERGRRIACPRFGTVTCTEHISIESELFERYFNGRRVAPRHLAVTADGKQLFDRFLDRDYSRVDDALKENALKENASTDRIADAFSKLVSGPLANPDARTRAALELHFSKTDRKERIEILEAAASAGFELFDLLRIGLKDSDPAVRNRAALTLAATANERVTDLVVDTTDRVEHAGARRALYGTLFQIGLTDPIARRALQIRQGLLAEGETVKAKNWLKALEEQSAGTQKKYASDFVPNKELDELDRKIESLTNKAEQEDSRGVHQLGLAEANFRYALNSIQNKSNPEFFFVDAETAAVAAKKKGATKWAVAALRARIAYLSGRNEEAGRLAEVALGGLREEAASPHAAAVLEIHAKTQLARIYQDRKASEALPGEAITEALQSYRVLAVHPLGTEKQAIQHAGLLAWLRTNMALDRVLQHAVLRFPDSASLHERYRKVSITLGGAKQLEASYDGFDVPSKSLAVVSWHKAYAKLIAAEIQVRAGRSKAADSAYSGSIASFAVSLVANRGWKNSIDHYTALAIAGRCVIALDENRLDAAVDLLLSAAGTRTASFKDKDGLGRTSEQAARRLQDSLEKAGKQELLDKLREGLQALGLGRS